MKILKRILIVLGVVIVVVLISAAFLNSEYAVEREIVINKPRTEVFQYIKFIKNQDEYSVWNQRDPNAIKTSSGTDGTVGYIYTWDSENEKVGKGEQEIKNIIEGERIEMALHFKEPFEANDLAYMATEDTGESQTRVKWGFSGKMSYPTNLMLLFIDMEDMLGNDLQQGLENLKQIVEAESAQ